MILIMAVLSKRGCPTCPNHGWGLCGGGDSLCLHTTKNRIYLGFIRKEKVYTINLVFKTDCY